MKKQNNPKVIPIILDILQESSYMTGELFSAFMCGYGESYRRINKILYDRQSGKSTKESWGDKFIDEQRFYDAVNYLKRNGFIEKKKGKKDKKISFWAITKKGKEKFARENYKNGNYVSEDDSVLRIIIFDIPEKERRKRDWLRESIREIGFSLLQGSVWIGKKKIPEEFMNNINEAGIFKHVHIFSIDNEGTILVDKNVNMLE